jgi:hypothetical protein
VALPYDSAAKFLQYAHPQMIVSTGWLAEHLDDPGLVVAESDEDVLLYETGHIPGAVKLDWHTELNDPVTRDYVDGPGFAALMSAKGISRDTTLVLYGDRNNWWAAYALWVCSLTAGGPSGLPRAASSAPQNPIARRPTIPSSTAMTSRFAPSPARSWLIWGSR